MGSHHHRPHAPGGARGRGHGQRLGEGHRAQAGAGEPRHGSAHRAGHHRQPWIDWWEGWGAAWQIDQGDIRISDRVKGWPGWVVEYIVAHELAHRRHPNHSKDFWALVNRYPKTERARGFLMGVGMEPLQD